MGPATWRRDRETVNRVQLDVRAAFPQAQEEFTSGEQWNW